jgi:hypothetical protein
VIETPLCTTNRVTILLTQVRMVADRIGATSVLPYQCIASHAFRACLASAPPTCSLHVTRIVHYANYSAGVPRHL